MSCDKLFHRGNSSSIHWEQAGLAVECQTPNQEDLSLISHWGRRVVSLNKTQQLSRVLLDTQENVSFVLKCLKKI